jgi:acetyl esterase/lipase
MRTTGQKITELCESERVHHQVVRFDVDGFPPAALHFISSSAKNGSNILMYLHGGGYLYPMSSAHFKFARQAANRVTSTLVILEYGLSPEIKYPGQLAQAAAALQYLLQYHKPSEIVLGGDSAGGNLTLGLLAHLREPHPLIASVKLTEPLRAAFCISPRCSNECTAKSFTSNASKDVISSQTVTLINKNWDPVMTDVWATPNVGNREFWRKVYAKDLLITCGSDEVYLDDIKYLASIIGAEKEDGAKVQLAICPGEIHIQAISDFGLGIEDGQMLTTVFAWLHTI